MHQSPVMHPAEWTRSETGSIDAFSEHFTDDELESLERIVACYRHHLKRCFVMGFAGSFLTVSGKGKAGQLLPFAGLCFPEERAG